MNNRVLFASAGLALFASQAFAQQPATSSVTAPIRLDGIAAIVSDQVITLNDLRDAIIAKIQRKEIAEPKDSVAYHAIEVETLNDMIQDELIIQKAKDLKITINDADIAPQVDRQLRETRAMFQNNEGKFREELQKAALGTPDEFRRYLMEQYRRQFTRDRVLAKLQQDGKIIPISVSEAEISAEFDKAKQFLPPKPASVTFKQIVIAPQPIAAAKEVARVKAESVLAQIKGGADFEKIAKRESMDLETKETGGDLGWVRRGSQLSEFERWLFGIPGYQNALPPGQLSPVFETPYGFHIVRVDRVQTGEVKARHILIAAKIDSADIERTRKLADSVAGVWRAGSAFDSLAKKFHDYAGREETSILTPYWRDSLPATYQRGFADKKPGDIVAFQIAGSAKRPDIPKFVVAQLVTVDEGGERTLGEMREAVRSSLAQRGGVRRYIDGLRKQTYVAVKLDQPTPTEAAKAKPDELPQSP
jgi:peptidyl-prolyl cis-trans isomerase SurA